MKELREKLKSFGLGHCIFSDEASCPNCPDTPYFMECADCLIKWMKETGLIKDDEQASRN